MKANIEWQGRAYEIDFNEPIDISIPMSSGTANPNAFGIQPPLFEPVKYGGFVGSVRLGGSVNCENLFLNAHGNGTHTECVGHISKEKITINQCLRQFVFIAQLMTVELIQTEGDEVIPLSAIEDKWNDTIEALVLRTVPNTKEKLTQKYSGNNPAYVESRLCEYLCAKNIRHLLLDLPSVDKESDNGMLDAHHRFWNYPQSPRMDATITEMIYVDDTIEDGIYLLHIQIASLETDASPSKPVLYQLKEKKNEGKERN